MTLSVYGDYIKWEGTNEHAVTWALYLDKPNRFAIKSFFNDTTLFLSKVPGNINLSGQWAQKGDALTLKFYFPPPDWTLFDSLVSDKVIKVLDEETIEIDQTARAIWIYQTECRRIK